MNASGVRMFPTHAGPGPVTNRTVLPRVAWLVSATEEKSKRAGLGEAKWTGGLGM